MPARPHRPLLAGALLGLALALASAPARPAGELEAKIKAAYVYHVLKFVDFPPPDGDALRLCIVGTDPVAALLPELAGKQVKERSLKIDIDPPPELAGCNAVFIGRSERRWADIVARRRSGLLTVSDVDGFASAGGMVGFFADGGRIKLDVNPEAARQAHLKISAKLLELARTAP